MIDLAQGLLWYDDRPRPLDDTIRDAARAYGRRLGQRATVCCVPMRFDSEQAWEEAPARAPERAVALGENELRVVPLRAIGRHCVMAGVVAGEPVEPWVEAEEDLPTLGAVNNGATLRRRPRKADSATRSSLARRAG